jgi:hypothetical protein
MKESSGDRPQHFLACGIAIAGSLRDFTCTDEYLMSGITWDGAILDEGATSQRVAA